MNVLAVVAHPDDEVLGAGASLARHVDTGDAVSVVALTDGVGARGGPVGEREVAAARRRAAADAAARALGVDLVAVHTFPDNGLDTVALLDVVRVVESLILDLGPQVVYTHHWGDLNVDHRVCHEAVVTAARPQPGAPVAEIRTMEVPSASGWRGARGDSVFQPDTWIDATGTWDRKCAAADAYAEELRPPPHARSMPALDALARWRGSEVGLDRAEAFVTIRRIIR